MINDDFDAERDELELIVASDKGEPMDEEKRKDLVSRFDRLLEDVIIKDNEKTLDDLKTSGHIMSSRPVSSSKVLEENDRLFNVMCTAVDSGDYEATVDLDAKVNVNDLLEYMKSHMAWKDSVITVSMDRKITIKLPEAKEELYD